MTDKKLTIILNLIPQKRKSLAEKYLKGISVPAKVAYAAAKNLLGDFSSWECETVEITLGKEFGDIPSVTFQKIFACQSLASSENIILDTAAAFKNFAVVFNNQSPIADIDEVIHVREAAWAVVALNSFDVSKRIYLDYDPVSYLARLMHHEGFLVAPPGLGFVQENLDSLNKNTDLVPQIKKALLDGDKIDDSLIGTQVLKISAVKEYVNFKFGEQEKEMANLTKELDVK